MKNRKLLFLIIATILLIGGIMGVVKGLMQDMEWLSFRYLIRGGSTFEKGHMPTYARIYGVIMGLLEIVSAIFIFMQKKRLLIFVVIMLIINLLGCIAAIFIGDMFAIVSMIVRVILLYLVIKNISDYKHT